MLGSFINNYARAGLRVALLKEDNLIPRVFIFLLRPILRHSTHRPFSLHVILSRSVLFWGRNFGFGYISFWRRLCFILNFWFFFLQKFIDLVYIVLNNILIFLIHLLQLFVSKLSIFRGQGLFLFFRGRKVSSRCVATPIEDKIISLIHPFKCL